MAAATELTGSAPGRGVHLSARNKLETHLYEIEPLGFAARASGRWLPVRRDRTDHRRWQMRTYERPTLTRAGNFTKITGMGGSGPRDVLGRHQSL